MKFHILKKMFFKILFGLVFVSYITSFTNNSYKKDQAKSLAV